MARCASCNARLSKDELLCDYCSVRSNLDLQAKASAQSCIVVPRCTRCAAPLRPRVPECRFCGLHNDLDLSDTASYEFSDVETVRECPQCHQEFRKIELKFEKSIQVERCDQCFGMFFGPRVVEHVLDHGVSHVNEINHKLLDNVNRDRYRKDNVVTYRKCPVCGQLMGRRNFGYRSGVVIDHCQFHGVWLDNGELRHLLEWKKAGGVKMELSRRYGVGADADAHLYEIMSRLSDQEDTPSLSVGLRRFVATAIRKIFGR